MTYPIRYAAHIVANDTKVYRKSFSETDYADLQADLKRLVEWSEKWQLKFNADKSKVLYFGRNNRCLGYKMGDIELQSTKVEKDLGVYVDEQLKFHQQITFAVIKSGQML
jgi:hypothetical protein